MRSSIRSTPEPGGARGVGGHQQLQSVGVEGSPALLKDGCGTSRFFPKEHL